MEVEAFSQKISNVLSKGKFIIPDYQREYDWDESEINELLEDLEDTILCNDLSGNRAEII